jgi:hypothetical protein
MDVPQLSPASATSLNYISQLTACLQTLSLDKSKSKYVTTEGQSASLSWNKASVCGLRPDFYYCQTVGGLLMWGALSEEDGSIVYKCSWPSPAQSFLGPSPVGLVTIFYRLRFWTSLFVASYDSQGYGGGIQPRLHMGVLFNTTGGLLPSFYITLDKGS